MCEDCLENKQNSPDQAIGHVNEKMTSLHSAVLVLNVEVTSSIPGVNARQENMFLVETEQSLYTYTNWLATDNYLLGRVLSDHATIDEHPNVRGKLPHMGIAWKSRYIKNARSCG